MRRILLVLTAAMITALMMVAMALPAFAKINCTPNATGDVCSPASGCGGEGGQAYGGSGGGGGGAHTTGEQVWGVEYAVRKGIPIPLLAQAVWGFYESRDADRLSAKAVAVLRNRYGGHPVHEKG